MQIDFTSCGYLCLFTNASFKNQNTEISEIYGFACLMDFVLLIICVYPYLVDVC